MSEFTNSPTAETIQNVVFSFFMAARFRISQDAACSSDVSVGGNAMSTMTTTYSLALATRAKQLLGRQFKELPPTITSIAQATFYREIITQSLTSSLPNPTWVGYHGMTAILNGEPGMHPSDEWHNRRTEFMQEQLKRFSDDNGDTKVG